MLDPTPIMQLTTAYWNAMTFLTANRIGVFEALAKTPMSVSEAADALNTHPRPTRLLLNSCVALGLLEESEGVYTNSALANAFLVPGSPAFMGNAVRYSDDLYATWGKLEQALRENRPPLAQETYLGDDPAKTRHFVYGMHNRALGIGNALAGLVDLSGRKQLLDIGGGPGTYSALFVRRYPELRAKVLDLPHVVELADEIIGSLGAKDRVSTLAGDYHTTKFPTGNDVVLISGVLHRESEMGCRELIGRAKDTLEPGGLLILSDVFTDHGGTGPLFATLFGLNMMLTAPEGGVHADTDVAAWMAEAGFTHIETLPFPSPMPHRVVTGMVG